MTSSSPVPARVLDLFAVPDDVRPLPGGQGRSVVAGDLVLSPGRDGVTQDWLSPVLARQAVALDLELAGATGATGAPGVAAAARPGGLVARAARGGAVRIAMPIPARDGSWVVDGWAASRYEPDTTACTDLDVLVATGRVLHARLAVAVTERPAGLGDRDDRWAVADRLVWGPVQALDTAVAAYGSAVADRWVAELCGDEQGGLGPGPDQLVHGDLAGNVLLDGHGTPVVIDLAPYWRPALWAEAVCVLDAVVWHGADPSALEGWRHGARRQAVLRAALFRVLSEDPGSALVADVVRAVA
ncbi:aminoglycoside phosphotransferase [Phycicoccus sp. Root563]|uniref:aminoglycoside phosphotransferase n=1 Tax=Phycicoccus sp. Root563 TaxID=1736562 RepID=UPI001F3C1D28|nr:aminoglycoside phosphotransferase [Phycicoccus sp. Root563]